MKRGENTRKTGQKYEELAVKYLEHRGYLILERNYRCPYGEIDIIARTGEYLVFVEVKYRKSTAWGSPEEAVDGRKQRRISRAALCFYGTNGYERNVPCRFDVIGVDGKEKISHIENAFDYRGSRSGKWRIRDLCYLSFLPGRREGIMWNNSGRRQ